MVNNMLEDKHVIETTGLSKVTIKNGKVTEVSDPIVYNCPIFSKYLNIEKFDKEKIKNNIEYRIKSFGYCTKDRKVKLKDMLSVGISEILRSNVKLGNLDCVVGACDGVGTLIMTNPDIIQGVGGRVSGLISTTPIPEVMEKVGIENVVNPKTAELNPIKGLQKAIDQGYKKIGITLIPSPIAKEIREYPIPDDVKIYLFIAHTTNITKELTEELFSVADIVTACASKNIREYAEKHKPYYYGNNVPIYAATDAGKMFLDERLKDIGKKPSINKYPQDSSNIPNPLK